MASAWRCLPIRRLAPWAAPGSQPVAECEGAAAVPGLLQSASVLRWNCLTQSLSWALRKAGERLLATPPLLFPDGPVPVLSVLKPRKHSSYLGTCGEQN